MVGHVEGRGKGEGEGRGGREGKGWRGEEEGSAGEGESAEGFRGSEDMMYGPGVDLQREWSVSRVASRFRAVIFPSGKIRFYTGISLSP